MITSSQNLARRLSVASTCYTAPFAAGAQASKWGGVASIIHGISTTAAGMFGGAELSIQQAITATANGNDRQTLLLTIDPNGSFHADSLTACKLIQQNMCLQQQKSQNEKAQVTSQNWSHGDLQIP